MDDQISYIQNLQQNNGGKDDAKPSAPRGPGDHCTGIVFIQLIIVNCLMCYVEHQLLNMSQMCKEFSFGREHFIQKRNLVISDLRPNLRKLSQYDQHHIEEELKKAKNDKSSTG